MASTRATGTAVFAIYVADALGYTGSVVVQLFNDLIVGDQSHLEFLETLSLSCLVARGAAGRWWWKLLLRKPITVDVAIEEVVAPGRRTGRR